MHRYYGKDVSALQQGASLQEPERQVHQLYLRGWKPGTDLAPRRTSRPVLLAGHQVSLIPSILLYSFPLNGKFSVMLVAVEA